MLRFLRRTLQVWLLTLTIASLVAQKNADDLIRLPLRETQPGLLYGAPTPIRDNPASSLEDLINAYLTDHEDSEEENSFSRWLSPLDLRISNLETLHNYLSELKKSKQAPVPQMVLDVLNNKLDDMRRKNAEKDDSWNFDFDFEDPLYQDIF
jgi:hypothetical protein